nr:sensor histidine kinase [Evansella caseinilytica]
MRSFWIWLLLLGLTWIFALDHFTAALTEMPLRILGTAVFFALFFLAPLFRKKQGIFLLLFIAAAVLAVVVLWPESADAEANPYSLLIYSILAGKAVYRLSARPAAGVGVLLFSGALAPGIAGYPSFSPVFVSVYAVVLGAAFAVYRSISVREEELTVRNEALLSEYRKMKRRIATDEKLAREEERAQIARDIHDSVGHKLTALLMQLEVFRMQTDKKTKERLHGLKMLAKESLEETRSAVKTLKQDDAGGLSAVISLIRKLEAESFIRIEFSVKHGAFSAPLSNEQAIAVYRAVQEALTNIMRHSDVKEAEILFEAPAGSIFYFEVSNPASGDMPFQEGFGLAAMRERMEYAGGQLDIFRRNERFVIRGKLPLLQKKRREVSNDSDSFG